MPLAVVDLSAVGALALLLAVAFLHPRPSVELTAGVAAVGVLLGTGQLPWSTASTTVGQLLPVVLFLCTSLVVGDLCAAEGVFGYLGAAVRRIGREPRRMLKLTTLFAALVTALLSLDATVVMLTPVVLAAAAAQGHAQGHGWHGRPLTHACVRMANSASLLLPVANLTNLLALPVAGLGFLRWAGVMTAPWLAVVLVEYVGLRLFFRDQLDRDRPVAPPPPAAPGPAADAVEPAVPVFVLCVLVAMLGGFALASVWGVQPFWVSGATAVVLGAHALARRTVSPVRFVASSQVSFAVFVLALGVVVAAVAHSFLGDVVETVLTGVGIGSVSSGSTLGLGQLLLLVGITAVLANLVNNLPAVLLLLPVVAPWGTLATLTVLVGVNVGAGLSYSGSLANLLWRRVLVLAGAPPSARTFHVQAAAVVPVAMAVAVCALWAEGSLGWL